MTNLGIGQYNRTGLEQDDTAAQVLNRMRKDHNTCLVRSLRDSRDQNSGSNLDSSWQTSNYRLTAPRKLQFDSTAIDSRSVYASGVGDVQTGNTDRVAYNRHKKTCSYVSI